LADPPPRHGFTIEWTFEGCRTLVLTGPWSSEAESALRAGDADGLWLNFARGWCGSRDLTFLPDGLPVRHLLVLDPTLESFAGIEQLSAGLEFLRVGDCRPTARLELWPLVRLTRLHARWQQVVETLSQAASLRHLVITDGYESASLENFPLSGRLQALKMYEANRLESLNGVQAFAQLESLRIVVARRLRDIAALASMRESLLELEFYQCPRLDSLAAVGELTRLRSLEVNNCRSLRTIKPVGALANLDWFEALGTTRIGDGDLSPLLRLPSLTKVRIDGHRGYSPSVSSIKQHLRGRGAPTPRAWPS